MHSFSSIEIININPQKLTKKERNKERGRKFFTLSAKFNAFQAKMLFNQEEEWEKFKKKNKKYFDLNPQLTTKTLSDLIIEKVLRPKNFLEFIIGK